MRLVPEVSMEMESQSESGYTEIRFISIWHRTKQFLTPLKPPKTGRFDPRMQAQRAQVKINTYQFQLLILDAFKYVYVRVMVLLDTKKMYNLTSSAIGCPLQTEAM